MNQRLLVSPAEAAEMMQLSRSKLYELIRSGEIRSVRIGACRRIPVDVLQEYVTALSPNRA